MGQDDGGEERLGVNVSTSACIDARIFPLEE